MAHTDTLPEAKKPKLKLVIWPDECLKYAVAPFPEAELGSKLVRNTAGGMIRAMYEYGGVGLAAPQVAVPFQIFTMDAYWT
ncbi:MAG: peptide deformylase, partial [Methanomassiliicoccales archaeon]|nr:peptide deformylase [Methanomassiliicoccales archaeon]